VVDTRWVGVPFFGGPAFAASETRTLPVRPGVCNIPSTARAYSMNFTVVPHESFGYLTTGPTGVPRPTVSTLNALTGAVTANAAIVPAGTNGSIDVFTTNRADVIIDINGYFAPPVAGGLSFYTTAPCRVVDTRWVGVPLFGGPAYYGTREFPVSQGGCQVPAGSAYSLNATVVPHGTLAYLALWPSGMAQPTVSTLNAFDGSVTSNAAIVPATNGSIKAYCTNMTDLILDLNGYFAP
jgi:hypothetical protein